MRKFSLILALMLLPVLSHAGAFSDLDTALKASALAVTSQIQATAILWLGSFALIQMVVTNIGVLKSGGDIDNLWTKLLSSLLWFAFCSFILTNGSEFLSKVSADFFTKAAAIAGLSGFDAAEIIGKGSKLATGLISKINKASSVLDMFMPALLSVLMGFIIIMTSALIAFKVFLIKIETMLIVMLAPLSFSFLGLNALKDQGIAPFKSLISLIYRVLILAVILKAMDVMSNHLLTVINTIDSASITELWAPLLSAIMGFVLIAFLAFKSDSIASSLSSGSSSMGTGDVASAAAAGAALGAAVASGGASVAAGAGNVGKALTGAQAGTASVANASAKGAGTDLMKMAGGAGAPSSGAAAPSAFSTNSSGAPRRAEAASAGSSGSGGQDGTSGAGGNDGVSSLGASNTPAGGDFASAAEPVNPGAHAANMAVMQEMVATNPGVPKTSEQISGYAARLQPEGPSGKPEASETSGGAPVSGGGGASTAPDSPVGSAPEASGSGGAGSANASPPAGGFATNAKGAPIRPEPPASASGAGIGGATPSAQNAQTVANMGNQGAPKKSMLDHLASANQHMAQEKSSTSVSISTHNSD